MQTEPQAQSQDLERPVGDLRGLRSEETAHTNIYEVFTVRQELFYVL